MKRFAHVLLLIAVVAAPVVATHGATITVAPGEVTVNAGNGRCSLREAIANAESDSDTSSGDCTAGNGTDTIELAASSTYSLPDSAVTDAKYGNSGLPEINTTIVIDGNGATIQRDTSLFSSEACSGTGAKFRIVYVGPTGNLTLNDVTMRYGCAELGFTGAGGAVFNRGTVNANDTTIASNQAHSSGGAIHNDGTMNLTRSTVTSSSTIYGAGGAIVNTATLNVLQSTVYANKTPGAGGGIDNTYGSAEIANSTLSGNSANGNGAGVFNTGSTATFTNATIADNHGTDYAATVGIGIYQNFGTVKLENTLVALQTRGTNCSGISSSTNSFADDGSCSGATYTATPMIGGLADNGGPTLTHALLSGSPAIDTGDNSICSASPVNGVDQRGEVRPRYGATANNCDVGAFEAVGAANVSLTKTVSPASVVPYQNVIYTVTASNAGPDIASDVVVTDPLASGLDFVSATPSQGSCNESGGTVTCDLGTIAASADATIEIVVTPTVSGTFTNSASATTSSIDADGAAATAPALVATPVPVLDPRMLALLALMLAAAGAIAIRLH